MIKDFSTYIREGRMSRLVNADATGDRKEDRIPRMIAELYSIVDDFNKRKDYYKVSKDIEQFCTKYEILPKGEEYDELVKCWGINPYNKISTPSRKMFYSGKGSKYYGRDVIAVCKFSWQEKDKRDYVLLAIAFTKEENDGISIFCPITGRTKWIERLDVLFGEKCIPMDSSLVKYVIHREI